MLLRRRRAYGILLAAGLATVLVGCGSGNNGNPANGGNAGNTAPNSSGSFTLDFIQTQTGVPYDNAMIDGIKQESARLGTSYKITGPATPGPSAQIPFIQQAIVNHVGAILINPDSPTAVLSALNQAKAAGIKTVEINDDSLPESTRVAAVTALNYGLVPAAQMALLGKLMHYSGDFAVLSASSTSVFQNQVIQGYKKILKTNPKYKNMHLVKIAYGNDVSATSADQTTSLLTEFPNLKAITSPTTVGLAAAAQAIESAHKAKKIILTGLGEPVEMKKFILDGTVKEYQLWDPTNMGIAGTYIAYEASKGVAFPPGKKFTVPGSNLGTLTVSKDGSVWCQRGLTTFNKANVNKYHF